MAIAGRVAIVPKGDYDKNASYKRLDCVKYLNVMYVAKKDVPIGTAITDESYWMKGVEGGGGGGSSVIDDTQSSTLTTYSSNKINEFISDINDSLGDKIDTTGDVSEAVVSTLDEIPNTRLIPSVGDKIKVMFAKTIKYFQDLKTIAFTGDYEDLLNKPSIPTVTNNLLATESGTALDAVQGKAINDKIGSTDISGIGDGSVTGALSTLNSNIGNIGEKYDVLGIYNKNNINGPGANPAKEKTTIALKNNITYYRFLLIISAYYNNFKAVYGHILIPTSLFLVSGETIYYPVRISQENVKFDAIERNVNGNTYINLVSNSSFPMTVFGIK